MFEAETRDNSFEGPTAHGMFLAEKWANHVIFDYLLVVSKFQPNTFLPVFPDRGEGFFPLSFFPLLRDTFVLETGQYHQDCIPSLNHFGSRPFNFSQDR